MLLEGGGTKTVGNGPSRSKPPRKPAPTSSGGGGGGGIRAGITRLQEYVAEPSDTRDPVSAARSTSSSGVDLSALSTAYTSGAPSQTLTRSDALSAGYAAMSGVTETEEAAETEKTRDAIRTDTQRQEEEAKTYRARKAKEMSWDDYLGLSDRQRAAVDFNTMLVQARQKDLRKDYEPNDAQKRVYDKSVERMFGDEGVSETFAPETVALLTDVGFEQTDARRFDDLDDFLGLSAALTAKDIDRIKKLNPSPIIGSGKNQSDMSLGGLVEVPRPNETAADVATTLAAGTNKLEESLTRGKQVLENWKLVAAGARNESIGFLGGIPNRIAAPDIRVGGENDEYFQLAYDTLADAANGPEVVDLIRTDLGDKEFRRFMAYADTKSRYSLDQEVGLGANPAIQYRSPDEFRKVLGLGGGENDGTR